MAETAPSGQPAPGSTTAGGASGPRAGFGRRLAAYLIDSVLLSIVAVILVLILGAVAGDAGGVIGYIIAIVGIIAYYVYFHGGPTGQTLGKRAMGIRVIDYAGGGPIGYGRAVGRYFAAILSGIPCYLGYLWMIWDREKQTWHDKLTTSVVVPTDAYPVGR